MLQPLCQGKGQRSQRAKNRTEPFPGKIGRGVLILVTLALTVTELVNNVCERSRKKPRKKERKNSDARSKTKHIHLLWGYVMNLKAKQ